MIKKISNVRPPYQSTVEDKEDAIAGKQVSSSRDRSWDRMGPHAAQTKRELLHVRCANGTQG